MLHSLQKLGLTSRRHYLSLLALTVMVYLGNPALALLAGAGGTLLANKGTSALASETSRYLLQFAIVLLGFTLNIGDVWSISREYSGLVTLYVLITFGTGLLLGLILKVNNTVSSLVASGTAICGGTAVASLSPILKARADQTGVVMAIIFLLNACALLTFPTLGHWLNLSQSEFGLWCALAIHDTSSVLATAALYGEEALQVATTVKLGRTLWLIPALLLFSAIGKQSSSYLRLPLFLILFVLASLASSLLEFNTYFLGIISWLSKSLLVIALFFIGSRIDWPTLARIRGKTLYQALGLWIIVAPLSLLAVMLT